MDQILNLKRLIYKKLNKRINLDYVDIQLALWSEKIFDAYKEKIIKKYHNIIYNI